MNFDFSDDQKLLRDQARKFLTDKCDRTVVRSVLEDNHKNHSDDLWKEISSMGWTGTAIPEEYGGLGLGMLELCVIAEELGRSLAPTPFSSSIYLFAEFVKLFGTEDQKKSYLPKIASGEMIGTFALSEGNGTPKSHNINSTFTDGKLNGQKLPVNDGHVSDFIIVAANTDSNKNNNSLSLVIVKSNQDGVKSESLETIDPSRPSSKIVLDNADAELLGNSGEGWEMIQKIFDRAAVLFAFEQVGGAQVALDEAKNILWKDMHLENKLVHFKHSSTKWPICMSKLN